MKFEVKVSYCVEECIIVALKISLCALNSVSFCQVISQLLSLVLGLGGMLQLLNGLFWMEAQGKEGLLPSRLNIVLVDTCRLFACCQQRNHN